MYTRHRYWSKLQLKEPPSFYFHRQVSATFIEDRAGIEARHRIGVDNLMWSSDYPHTDTTWPNSRQYIEKTFAGVNEEDRHKMLVGNAARLYRWDEEWGARARREKRSERERPSLFSLLTVFYFLCFQYWNHDAITLTT